jgi:hypothetical protein
VACFATFADNDGAAAHRVRIFRVDDGIHAQRGRPSDEQGPPADPASIRSLSTLTFLHAGPTLTEFIMRILSTPSARALRFVLLSPAALALGLALSACGGGSGDAAVTTPPATAASAATVQETSANTSVVPAASTEALDETIFAAQASVATILSGQASQTVNCPGGGTAMIAVTGALPLATLTNGQFDAGETYTLTYTDCKGALGRASVNGQMTLTVNEASSTPGNTHLALATATTNVVVSLPRGNLTLNGASTVTRDVVTTANTTVTTTHWVTPSFTVVTAFGARTSTFAFTNVDRTRVVTRTNNVVTSTTHSGTCTLSATLPNGSFTVTESTTGTVTFDANGVPTSGTWTYVLPHNTIVVTIGNGIATVTVDWGSDGTIDRTYTFQINDLAAQAG